MRCNGDFHPDVSTRVGALELATPLVPASGILPMDSEHWGIDGIDACCTKGLTLHERPGNPKNRVAETPSGMLNSIGLENPGVARWVRETLPVLERTGRKIVLNLACETLPDLAESLRILKDAAERVSALELNVSCPNVDGGGQAWGVDEDALSRAVSVARENWSGALWVKLTPQARDFVASAKAAEACGADALVVANTWLGMKMDTQAGKPFFHRVVAGLSGPAIFPLTLRLVYETAPAVRIPIVACGGVFTADDVLAMLLAGASACEIGVLLFTDLGAPARICGELSKIMEQKRVSSLSEFIGAARKS